MKNSELFKNGFVSASERMLVEAEERKRLIRYSLKFGDRFLDKILQGILPTDFILFGALSGAGKTEKAVDIALANVLEGRRVHFFALEAEKYEIERRLKFKQIMKLYFDDPESDKTFFPRYSSWYLGKYKGTLDAYEDQAMTDLNHLKNLFTFYRSDDFGISEYERMILSLKGKTELIICDHLHYFDLDDPNENKAVKDVMKKIRDLVLICEVPVVLIAHLRKMDRRFTPLVPDLDDFHGTSDIGKIVTKAITMAPAGYKNAYESYTYMRPVKSRMEGMAKRYTARMTWDTLRNTFTPSCVIGEIKGQEFIPLDDDQLPEWLK